MAAIFVTFIVTSGDRFEAAAEINELFENKSPVGRLYVTLREAGFHPERDWPLREEGIGYRVDLALPLDNNEWLLIVLSAPDLPAPAQALRFPPDSDPAHCAHIIQQTVAKMGRG